MAGLQGDLISADVRPIRIGTCALRCLGPNRLHPFRSSPVSEIQAVSEPAAQSRQGCREKRLAAAAESHSLSLGAAGQRSG